MNVNNTCTILNVCLSSFFKEFNPVASCLCIDTYLYICMCVHTQSLSHVQLFATPWTVAHLVPLSMEFSRQEHWSKCHFLLQRIFLTQGSSLHLLCFLHWQTDSLSVSHLGRPFHTYNLEPKKKTDFHFNSPF